MPAYDFKKAAEFAWFVFLSALIPVLLVVYEQDFSAITDWSAWGFGLLLAAARAAAGAILAKLGAR